ncbi:fluoride efflux transporter CrcB [Phormidium tenue FACHB-886]|nr:fluoride efflux transporter CrcB [Phormidium tenue FACHB-886]
MLTNLLNIVLVALGKPLSLLASVDPALRAPIEIALGAIPGALSRYYLTLLFARWFGANFPYGTFFINLTGALVMGFFTTLMLERTLTPDLRLLLAVGFLGSYTTFSTYALDTSVLLQNSSYRLGLLYWAGSAVLGVVSLELGSFLARKLS